MNRWGWKIIFTCVIAATLMLAGSVVVAAGSPFTPAHGPLYRVQRSLEEAVVTLRSSPAGRASLRIDLANRRLEDVGRLAGGPHQDAALAELEQALREAVQAVSQCPQSNASRLRENLLALFEQVGRTIPPGEAGVGDFRRWMAAVTQLLRQPGLQLADLASISAGPTRSVSSLVSAAGLSQVQPTPTPAWVDPRMIYFHPGSSGAKHAFYPLEGQHGTLPCAKCHLTGAFAGTGKLCEDCHLTNKPATHFPGRCELCHAPTQWIDIHYQHTTGLSSECATCHQANQPANHYPGQCSACHSTSAWLPATFNHAAAQASDCAACHGSKRPANHYNGQCSACHSTTAWSPATFNHGAAGAVNCISCHTNRLPANHYSGQCSVCHSTTAWSPATFNHAAVGAVDCAACHSENRPASHYSGQCSACHNTNGWLPAVFNHAAVGATDCTACHANRRPANHYNGQCSACHNTNAWQPATFNHAAVGATDCAACHSGNRPANHYDGQCSSCHNTSAWRPASFSHSFSTNHGGANGRCETCHPSGTSSWTCFNCHNESELNKKHNEKGIPDYASRCPACHSGGKGDD